MPKINSRNSAKVSNLPFHNTYFDTRFLIILLFLAYGVLSDPDKRKQYDQRDAFGGGFRGFEGGSFTFGGFNFDNLFNDFGDYSSEEDFPHRQHKRGGFGGDSHFNIFSDFPGLFDEVSTTISKPLLVTNY